MGDKHIIDKQEFYRLSRKLLLGNILNQWTFEEFKTIMQTNPGSLPEIVGVRHVRKSFTNKGNSGLMKRRDALAYGEKILDKHNVLFDEGAIHDCLTIQGEVMADHEGLYLRYSHLQVHQRTLWHIDHFGIQGLRNFQLPHKFLKVMTQEQVLGLSPVVFHARGLQASAMLQKYMDGSSWDMLNEILQTFYYPVVEFASFNRPIGQLRWNTLFWEVRTDY